MQTWKKGPRRPVVHDTGHRKDPTAINTKFSQAKNLHQTSRESTENQPSNAGKLQPAGNDK